MGSRTRLLVNVSMPDGSVPAGRGLAGWLSGIAPARARGEVTVAIVSDRRMRVLNRTFRGKDYATDVLAFPVGSGEPRVGRRETGSSSLGDIVIAAGVAVRQAREHRHTAGTECRLLALHGLLHLLGYDHEDAADEGRMARAEARLRKKAGLPLSLLGRTTVPPAAPRKRPSASRHPDPGTRRKS